MLTVEIRIVGKAGSGKSTIGRLIGAFLLRKGYFVAFRDDSERQTVISLDELNAPPPEPFERREVSIRTMMK